MLRLRAGGDVFKFVQEMERLTFWESLKYLAERHGIPLPKRTDLADEEAKKRGAVYEMNEIALRVYQDLLHAPSGQEARAYLKHRGLNQAVAEEFNLGLSERGGQMLVRIFENKASRTPKWRTAASSGHAPTARATTTSSAAGSCSPFIPRPAR
ncbi:MAG: hypothetical protein QM757_33345 [Paludibaculum sp.]